MNVLIAFATLVAMTHSSVAAGEDNVVDGRASAPLARDVPEFRYIIVSNEVNGKPPDRRVVWVLLDAAAFSEDTLRKLYPPGRRKS